MKKTVLHGITYSSITKALYVTVKKTSVLQCTSYSGGGETTGIYDEAR
jgi:hypothetical protein